MSLLSGGGTKSPRAVPLKPGSLFSAEALGGTGSEIKVLLGNSTTVNPCSH
jgi:hypothetical protein